MHLSDMLVVFERHPIEPGGHDIDWLDRRCPRCRQAVQSARGPEFGMETEGALKGLCKRGPVGSCEDWAPGLYVVIAADGRVAPCTDRDRAIAMSGEEAWKGARVVEYSSRRLLDGGVERIVHLKNARDSAKAWRVLADVLDCLGYGRLTDVVRDV